MHCNYHQLYPLNLEEHIMPSSPGEGASNSYYRLVRARRNAYIVARVRHHFRSKGPWENKRNLCTRPEWQRCINVTGHRTGRGPPHSPRVLQQGAFHWWCHRNVWLTDYCHNYELKAWSSLANQKKVTLSLGMTHGDTKSLYFCPVCMGKPVLLTRANEHLLLHCNLLGLFGRYCTSDVCSPLRNKKRVVSKTMSVNIVCISLKMHFSYKRCGNLV